MRLSGKIAVITGGARGLGASMCQLFAAEGAEVLAVDVIPPVYTAPSVTFVKLDITDSAAETCHGAGGGDQKGLFAQSGGMVAQLGDDTAAEQIFYGIVKLKLVHKILLFVSSCRMERDE